MPPASDGDRVRVHYTGTLADGTVFDTTEERGPLELVIGVGKTLQPFEQALIGMEPGERKSIDIPARQAFGGRQRTLLRVLKRELFTPGQKIKVGQRLRIDQGDGTEAIVEVTRVTGDDVMVDMNHPLAGRDLTFAIELVDIV